MPMVTGDTLSPDDLNDVFNQFMTTFAPLYSQLSTVVWTNTSIPPGYSADPPGSLGSVSPAPTGHGVALPSSGTVVTQAQAAAFITAMVGALQNFARQLTRYRRINQLWGQDPPITYVVVGSGMAALASSYEVPVSATPPPVPGVGTIITPLNFSGFISALYSATAAVAYTPHGGVSIRACHSSCHSSCHGSRGRR